MLPIDVDAILRAHACTRSEFVYQKDHYALRLLLHTIGGGRPICALRRGPFARLLEKPSVKPALARAANGVLTPACLLASSPHQGERYVLTFSRWGGTTPRDWGSSYYQTSRRGQNLVLLLNFPATHDRAYRRLVQPDGWHPFTRASHPGHNCEPFTLAWARLDFDREGDEVLIEEVQCDWVKEARSVRDDALDCLGAGEPHTLRFDDHFKATPSELLSYVERVLPPYALVWQEAVLLAAIEFAYERLGSRRVYFHSYESGVLMKRLSRTSGPPRSLYTDLPQRFCFERTRVPPLILRSDPRVWGRPVDFYALSLV